MSGLFTLDHMDPPAMARSYITTPVFADFSDEADVVGTLGVLVPWQRYFEDVLPLHVKDIEVVLGNSCGEEYTMIVTGGNVTVKGEGDLHDTSFDEKGQIWTLGGVAGEENVDFYVLNECRYTISVYPTKELESDLTNTPMFYAVAVAVIFVFTAFVFLAYDWAVQLRQNKVLKTATRTQAIVSSLFPKNVQERIFKDVEEEVKKEEQQGKGTRFRGNRTKDQLRSFLDDGTGENGEKKSPTGLNSKPIADL